MPWRLVERKALPWHWKSCALKDAPLQAALAHKRRALGLNLPWAGNQRQEEVSLPLSFVCPLPSRCARVGLGASGWGDNYPEHSCDLLGLVNTPEPTALTLPTGWVCLLVPRRCVWNVAPSGGLVEPSWLASVCPRNLPASSQGGHQVIGQSLACPFLPWSEGVWRGSSFASLTLELPCHAGCQQGWPAPHLHSGGS